jgi:hypothetical protein
MGEKSYRHKKFVGENICDDKVENHQKCEKFKGVPIGDLVIFDKKCNDKYELKM